MKKKLKIISIISIIGMGIFLNSCFHKNVKKCNADDVESAYVYELKDTSYLINYESVFQAKSKSTSGGTTRISGYNEMRISVYNINTGKLVSRKKTSKYLPKKYTFLLGISNDKIWLYSVKYGLYALNPLTLEKEITQEDIIAKNQQLKDNLAEPENIADVFNYFNYNFILDKILICDNKGYKYALDTKTLETEKINNETKISTSFIYRYFNTYAELDDADLSLSGDVRKNIEVEFYNPKSNDEIKSSESFLDGQFIIGNDLVKIFKEIEKKYVNYKSQINVLENKMDSLTSLYGNSYTDEIIKLKNKISSIENKFFNIETSYNKLKEGNFVFANTKVLNSDSNSFFISHKSNTNKDAKLMITKMKLNNKNSIEKVWETKIEDIYYDVEDAKQTSSFKKTFSKGSPVFDFSYFNIVDDKLIFIYMLHICCIDINSGKIIWTKQV